MHTRAALTLIIIAIGVAAWTSVLQGSVGDVLHAYALNVGQGDAIYIRTEQGIDVLIDGGPGGRVIPELARAMPPGDKHIDVMILTHPHYDHSSGLERVLNEYEVATIYIPSGMPKGEVADMFLKVAQQEVAEVRTLDAGDRIVFDVNTHLDVFLPVDASFLYTTDNPNEWSVVAKLIHKDASLLLTGDMERREELLLLRSDADVSSDALKVAHHGSAYASIVGLLDRIRPDIAFVSVGKNTYGHPNPDTIGRLTRAGATVLRTDEEGTIHLVSDGVQFRVEPSE